MYILSEPVRTYFPDTSLIMLHPLYRYLIKMSLLFSIHTTAIGYSENHINTNCVPIDVVCETTEIENITLVRHRDRYRNSIIQDSPDFVISLLVR